LSSSAAIFGVDRIDPGQHPFQQERVVVGEEPGEGLFGVL
jgi:hypothetical protein